MAENISNDATTTLNGALDSSQTNVAVVSGTGFPAANFRIRADNELMLVTSIGTGANWTATRGIEGTTAAAHSSGASVAHLITTGGLAQYLAERYTGIGTGTADARTFLRGDLAWSKGINVVEKITDTSRASTVAISNDPDLQLAVSASKTYFIRMTVFASVVTNAHGFRWRLVGPASPTLIRSSTTLYNPDSSGSVNSVASAFDAGDSQVGIVSAGEVLLIYNIVLQNGANSGTVALSWAQGTSNVSATIVRGGSFLEYVQMN